MTKRQIKMIANAIHGSYVPSLAYDGAERFNQGVTVVAENMADMLADEMGPDFDRAGFLALCK